MTFARGVCLVALAACGFRSGAVIGGDATSGRDAATVHDASLDAPPVTLSGSAFTFNGSSAVAVGSADITITTAPLPGTVITTATSNGSGVFMVTVPEGFVGVLHATAATYLDTYMPLVKADESSTLEVEMITTAGVGFLAGGCNAVQASTDGILQASVIGTNHMGLAGAAFTLTPSSGNTCYLSGDTFSGSATSTSASGFGFILNVAPGSPQLSAQETGDTFTSLAVPIVANAYTSGFILQQ